MAADLVVSWRAGRVLFMSTIQAGKTRTGEVAIFGRILNNGGSEMSPEAARYFLTLQFVQEDQARMAELAERNQAGGLSPEEREELMSFVQAGHLLALLHSRARKTLKERMAS
jgi:hypothetical protein